MQYSQTELKTRFPHAKTHAEQGLLLLDEAAKLAVVPVSNFRVGAVAFDAQGNAYLGANQEYFHAAMAQTVHAEQSAIMNAWLADAVVCEIVVNHTPCGHCRQFMNELPNADAIRIHLPHQQNNRLSTYLPDSFGPKDLQMQDRLSASAPKSFHTTSLLTPLNHAALLAAQASYAPYSGAHAGVALRLSDGTIISGRYAENAAYNPSLPPLQCALNRLHLSGKTATEIEAGALACVAQRGHEAHFLALWQAITQAPYEIIALAP